MTDEPQGVIRETLRLLRPFWVMAAFGAGLGLSSGVATAWLLATINRGLHDTNGVNWSLLFGFATLCFVSVAGTAASGAVNSVIGQKLIASLRKDISVRILRAPISLIESYRAHRLIAVLTNDVDTVSVFTFNFSGYAIALAVMLGGLVYLWILSGPVFAIALTSLVVWGAINMAAKRGWIRDYEGVRVAQDELHRQYRAVTDGSKELKISRPRRARVYGLLSTAADKIATLKSRAMLLFWIGDGLGSAVFFAAIGVLLALREWLALDPTVVSGAVIVLLYVKGPTAQLASALPAFDQARISFRRIAELSIGLDRHEPNISVADVIERTPPSVLRSIELRDVTYAFPAKEGIVPFSLGPIDLTVRRGEILFIVGDNGSGKTTLIKLLLGLYAPQRGSVLRDGVVVTPEGRDEYRQLFTTIFSDYYLFDEFSSGETTAAEVHPHLVRLGIDHKVRVEAGRFSTTDLSTGQRKRLALVHAYLENRSIIVTDEWAADQDSEFRRLFYEELLPKFKAQGRTLIVISHDDRYFSAADRIVRMKEGRIVDSAGQSFDGVSNV